MPPSSQTISAQPFGCLEDENKQTRMHARAHTHTHTHTLTLTSQSCVRLAGEIWRRVKNVGEVDQSSHQWCQLDIYRTWSRHPQFHFSLFQSYILIESKQKLCLSICCRIVTRKYTHMPSPLPQRLQFLMTIHTGPAALKYVFWHVNPVSMRQQADR